MRQAFIRALCDLAAKEPRIVLLTADLGYTVLEPFAEKYPKRYFNVGVAEQNMLGVATGLAEAGFIPFVYSMATFLTLRPYEFIRNGPVLHRLPIRLIGVGGGFEYGTAGFTHHALEDIGLMRMLPGMSIFAPADYQQAENALRTTWETPGPIYYRLGKDDKTVIPGLKGSFQVGRLQTLRSGTDVLFLTLGSIAPEALSAAEILSKKGIFAQVSAVSSIQPTPLKDLQTALSRFSLIITVEAHAAAGGLGSLVAEVAAEQGISSRVIRCAVHVPPHGRSGSQNYWYRRHSLDSASLVETVLRQSKLHTSRPILPT